MYTFTHFPQSPALTPISLDFPLRKNYFCRYRRLTAELVLMRCLFISLLALILLSAGCGSASHHKGQKWTVSELKGLQGKTRDEVREVLGTPNGFYTRSAEGRWHYSDLLLDPADGSDPRKVWIVIYFSQFGDQRATLVEIHDKLEN
jgi:hypothetical protein